MLLLLLLLLLQPLEQGKPSHEPTTPQKSDMAYPACVYVPAVSKQDAKELITLSRSLPTEVESVLSQIGEWQFDSFKLSAAANGRPLSLLGFYLISRSELISKVRVTKGSWH